MKIQKLERTSGKIDTSHWGIQKPNIMFCGLNYVIMVTQKRKRTMGVGGSSKQYIKMNKPK